MVGKTISHYKILEKLGEGGMGVVYKAHDTKLDRDVALKFLPVHLNTSAEEISRFQQEARAISTLNHPNIETIYDVDEVNGQKYLVLEYIPGGTLKSKLKQLKSEDKRFSIEEVIDYGLQLAEGLAHAHRHQIIHRDVKTDNILLTEEGKIKLTDFGLAKLRGTIHKTRTGSTLGTLSYMSPEQIRGEEVDQRSDIFSLGVVLYELLTSHLPFVGEYEAAVSYAILNENHPKIRSVRPEVQLELEKIIDRCLEKEKSKRYQQADEIITDLRALQQQMAGILVVKKKKVKIPLYIGISILILTVIAICYLFLIPKSIPIQEKSIAVLPFIDMSPQKDQEYFCDGMTEQITTNLSKLQKLRVRGRNSAMHFKNTTKTIPQIAKELNVDYLMEGSIRKVQNRVRVTVQLIKATDDYHLWANDYDRELDDVLDVQDDIAKTITGILLTKLSGEEEEKIKTKRPTNTEAYEYYLKGKYYHGTKFMASSYIEDFVTSEKMLLKAIELDSNYAPAYTELADLYNTYYNTSGITDEEKNKYLKLQEQFLQIAFSLDSSSAEVNRVKGSIYLSKGEKEKGYQYLKKSVELDINNIANNSEFGIFLSGRGLYYLAMKYYSRAIEIDPLSIRGYFLMANLYWKTGQFNEAEIYFKKALEIDANDVYTLFYYACLLYDIKKYNQFKEISLKHEKVNSNSAYIIYLRSLLYAANGEKEKAFKTYSKPDRSVKADFLIMRLYNHFGMYDEFIQYLNEDFERVKKIEESWYLWFKNHPLFDNLRSNPRFQEILEKHKQLYAQNLKKYKEIE